MVSDLFWVRSCKDKPISKYISIPPRWPLVFHCAARTTQGVTKQITSTALADCMHHSFGYLPLVKGFLASYQLFTVIPHKEHNLAMSTLAVSSDWQLVQTEEGRSGCRRNANKATRQPKHGHQHVNKQTSWHWDTSSPSPGLFTMTPEAMSFSASTCFSGL